MELSWQAPIASHIERGFPLAMHAAHPGWHEAQHLSLRCNPLYLGSPTASPMSVVKHEPLFVSSSVFSEVHVGYWSLHSVLVSEGEGVGADVSGQQPYLLQ